VPVRLSAPSRPPAGFGEAFTAHMITTPFDAEVGWGASQLRPFENLPMSPAMVGLHYGQVVFEGLKAHRRADGSLAVFRPEAHARRFQRSAERLVMPALPEQTFLQAVDDLVRVDGGELPADPQLSLYLRPVLFATEECLALRPARQYLFLVLAFVTGNFFSDRPEPVSVLISRNYSRAAPDGTGTAKCAGNYAGAYAAQVEAARAGCHQVVWLDPVERRWVEEMGGMNIFFVRGSGPSAGIVTPETTSTLLPGITRDSLLTMARDRGYRVSEEHVSVDQWRDECADGTITETFACGTAALVTPVGSVRDDQGSWTVGTGAPGPVTIELRQALSDIYQGRTPDPHGWMHSVS